jgi:hypothetical protein
LRQALFDVALPRPQLALAVAEQREIVGVVSGDNYICRQPPASQMENSVVASNTGSASPTTKQFGTFHSGTPLTIAL